MGRMLRVISLAALSVVLVAAVSLVGCAEEKLKDLVAPDMEISQYLKGTTVDFDDATLRGMAGPGGEGGFQAFAVGYSGIAVPAGTDYADLSAADKEVADAWMIAMLDVVEASIAAGDPLTTNYAYTTLHTLSGMSWFGKWGQGDFTAAGAFWATWPDPAGRGGKVEFMDYITANGLAGVTGNTAYTWAGAGAGAKYALQSAADRATIDADLATFLANIQAEAGAAFAAAAAAGQAELAANWPDALGAGFAAGMAANPDPYSAEFQAAFQAEIAANWPAANAAMVGAATMAMMGPVFTSEAFALLKTLGLPSAEGWAADVEAGVHPRQAFYIWIAMPAVSAMASAALMIQLSVAEFSIKVTNPNEYWISLDTLSVNAATDVEWYPGSGNMISTDMAKLALGDQIWVPPAEDGVDGEITVRLLAPVKPYDALVWGIMAGYDSTKAGGLVVFAFMAIQAGTAVWDVTIDAEISAETGTITESYTLQWTPE